MTDHISTLRIDLTGNLSPEAKAMGEAMLRAAADAKKLDEVLAQSGASAKMQDRLKALGASASHVEAATAALKAYRAAEEGAAGGKDWTRDQINGLKSLEQTTVAVVRAKVNEEKAAQAQILRLRGEEAREAKRLADQQIADVKRVAEAAEREARREASARMRAHDRELAEERRHNERMVEQRREMQHRMSLNHYVVGSVAAGVSAHGVVSGIERAAEAGSELQDTRLTLQRAGIDAQMRAKMEQQALDLSRRYGNVGQTAIMDLQKEARSVLRDQNEVFGTTEVLAKAKSVLDAGGGHSEGLGALVKGAESIGAANDPERLAKLIDGYVKAIQVMGKTINPEQIYQFDKYAKTAGATMSDRFLMTTGLSLSQEMGGSTAANDIFHAQKDIVGGFQNKHVPLKELARLGLVDHGDLERTSTGNIKGIKAGHKGVHDASTAQTDLDQWVYNTFLPALEKHGITNTQAQLAEVSKIFTGGEGDVITKLITQRESFENHAKMYGGAAGLNGADLNSQSASAGINAVNAALTNLMANVTVEGVAPAGKALFMVADGMNALAQAAAAHPDLALQGGIAAGAGALYGAGKIGQAVMNGFGGGAAAAEQVSAAGVQMTAAEMQLAAAGKGVAGAAGAGVAAATGEVTAVTLGGIVARALPPIALTVAAIDAGRYDAWVKAETAKTINTPAGQAVPDLEKQSWSDWILGRAPKPAAPIATDDGVAAPASGVDSGHFSVPGAYDREARARAQGGTSFAPSAPASTGMDITALGFVPISYREDDGAIGRGSVDRGPVEGQGVDSRLELAISAGTEAGVLAAFAKMKGDASYSGSGLPGLGDGGGSGGAWGAGGGGGARGNTPNMRYGHAGGGGSDGSRYRSTPDGAPVHARGQLAANQQEAYKAFLGEGFNETAARALVANDSGESLAAPGNYHWDRKHMSGGIAQWDPARAAAIKGKFGKNPWELSVPDQARAQAWEIRNNPRFAKTNAALQGTDGRSMIGALVANYESPADIPGNIASRMGRFNGFHPGSAGPGGVGGASGTGGVAGGTVGSHLADLKANGVLSDEQCVTLAMAGVGVQKGSGVAGANVHGRAYHDGRQGGRRNQGDRHDVGKPRRSKRWSRIIGRTRILSPMSVEHRQRATASFRALDRRFRPEVR